MKPAERFAVIGRVAGLTHPADGASSDRRSLPIRISKLSSAGIRQWSIRPPSPISLPGLLARRTSTTPALRISHRSRPQQVMDLQRLLIKQGYEGVGEIDGKIGDWHSQRNEESADEVRPPGRFLSDRRIDRAPSRRRHQRFKPLIRWSRRFIASEPLCSPAAVANWLLRKITRSSSSITSARLTAGLMNFGSLNQLKDGTEFHGWRMK